MSQTQCLMADMGVVSHCSNPGGYRLWASVYPEGAGGPEALGLYTPSLSLESIVPFH